MTGAREMIGVLITCRKSNKTQRRIGLATLGKEKNSIYIHK
jgi:hypothetical protein